MKKLLFGLALSCAAGAFVFQDHNHELCTGFVPENDLYISEFSFEKSGLTEAKFNEILDLVEDVYEPEIQAAGDELVVNRLWSEGRVNASAIRQGNKVVINMFGGLARHPEVTADGFTLVACHEMGHHLAGAPKVDRGWWGSWASNEGQSDYYATLKCFRKLFDVADNQEWLRDNDVDGFVESECDIVWSGFAERIACYRGAMAAMSVGKMFQTLRGQSSPPAYSTPDLFEVQKTDDRHPNTQCRLDSYFQGALCDKALPANLDNEDYAEGTCTREAGYVRGIRPLCWFKPPVVEDEKPKKPWWKRWWPFHQQLNQEIQDIPDGPYY